MKTSRIIALILAAALLIGLMAGCAAEKSAQTTAATTAAAASTTTAAGTTAAKTTAATQAATTAPPAATKIEFTYLGWNMGELEEGGYVETIIEEKLGDIDLHPVKVQLSDKEAVDLLLASGNAPDCGWWWRDPYEMYYDQLLTRTIPLSMVQEYAPSYYILMTDTVPYLSQINIPKDGDESVRLSLAGYDSSVGYSMYYFCSFYRLDWLEQFGILPESEITQINDKLYVAEKGLSLDNLVTYLDMCVNNDPDGNGQKDTYGLIGAQGFAPFRTIAAAFGVQDFCMKEDGKAVQYYSTQAYRDFLGFIQMLYADGLIDKEQPTLENAQYYEKAALGTAGMIGSSTCNALGSWAAAKPPLSLLEHDGAKLLMACSEVGTANYGTEGYFGTRVYGAYPSYNNFVVNRNVDDTTLAAILRFFEVSNFDEEARLASTHGIEGKTYTMENGKPVRIPDADQSGIGITSFAQYIQDPLYVENNSDGYFLEVFPYCVGSDSLYCKNLLVGYKDDPFNKTKLSEYSTDGTIDLANISQFVNEYFSNVLVGSANLDGDWDAYLNNLKLCGYDLLCEELDKGDVISDIVGTNGNPRNAW